MTLSRPTAHRAVTLTPAPTKPGAALSSSFYETTDRLSVAKRGLGAEVTFRHRQPTTLTLIALGE